MRRALVGTTVAILLAVCMTMSPTSVAAANPPSASLRASDQCDPVSTRAQFRGTVPSPQRVLGYPLGQQEATNRRSDAIGRPLIEPATGW
jgi:hypothetical protein